MLTSLIIAYLVLHGGASQPMQQHLEAATKAVDRNITVESTKKQALAILDSATKENKAFIAQRQKVVSALKSELADKNTTLSQIETTVKPLFADDSVNASHMTDAIFKLRGVLNASDWAKVFPAPEKK
jgi:hypothetical protein